MADIEATTGTSKSPTTTKPSTILVTSFPSNPITTTFKPSADCTGFYLNSNNIYVIADQTSCLPTTFKSQLSSFYSPGLICPQGYSTACHDTTGVSSITTVTCCPVRGDISLSCVPDPLAINGGFANFFCTWSAGSTTSVSITLSDDGRTRTTPVTFAGAEGINAYGVRMVYEATDLPTSTTRSGSKSTSGTATESGTRTTTGGTGTATSSPTSAPSSGMSTGAKAAIGVVIPLVVLAILAIVFLLWRRRKSKYRAVASAQSPGGSPMNDNKPPPEYGNAPIYELDNSGEPRELIGDTPALKQVHPAQLGDSR